MERPDFDSIKDFSEFSKYYWYREELIKLCKSHGLKAPSGKIELYKIIEAYFRGEKILPEKKPAGKNAKGKTPAGEKSAIDTKPSGKKPAGKKPAVTELTLETGLIECGFTFGPRFREFFEKQTGVSRFKFNVDMVATAKAVKERGDESFTLGDLLDIYYGKRTYASYDKSALLWNRFVKDFFADPATEVFPERLKTAAKLWKIVRESDQEKVYSHTLLEKYGDAIS